MGEMLDTAGQPCKFMLMVCADTRTFYQPKIIHSYECAPVMTNTFGRNQSPRLIRI